MERTLLHRRTVECHGYLRADGCFDIEGRMADRKTRDATMIDGRILPEGEPWHEMALRLCVDRDFVIREAEAVALHTPTDYCGSIVEAYRQLVGLRISPGFSQRVRELFAGRAGCTHFTELLGPIATTAYQTISGQMLAEPGSGGWADPKLKQMAVTLVDSCHVWSRESNVVRAHFPELSDKPG